MTSVSSAFLSLRAALEAAGVRFAIGGSWASTAYGEPRFTNAVDVLADFTEQNLAQFLSSLPADFYSDEQEALKALRLGRPFNVIFMPMAYKFDFFPAHAFPLGTQELDRAMLLVVSEISESPTPFVTPEDILLAKLHWFHAGGEISEVQWRDICGILRTRSSSLDMAYLEQNAAKLSLSHLLSRAFATA